MKKNEANFIDDYYADEVESVDDSIINKTMQEKFANASDNDKVKDTMKSEPFNESYERMQQDIKVIDAFCDVIEEDKSLKKNYAKSLMRILFLQLIAVNIIFVFYGLGLLSYPESAFNIFITGSLIEIIGLVTVAVKYLFKDNITKPLDNILEKNRKK